MSDINPEVTVKILTMIRKIERPRRGGISVRCVISSMVTTRENEVCKRSRFKQIEASMQCNDK